MPGSTATTRDMLFTKEDMTAAATASKLRNFRTSRYNFSPSNVPAGRTTLSAPYSFRSFSPRYTGYRNVARAGAKGKGTGSSFRFSQGVQRYGYGKPFYRESGKGKAKGGRGNNDCASARSARSRISQVTTSDTTVATAARSRAAGIGCFQFSRIRTLSSQAKESNRLVAQARIAASAAAADDRSDRRQTAATAAEHGAAAEEPSRRSEGRTGTARIRRRRSGLLYRRGCCQTPHSLVCSVQSRDFRSGKESPHSGCTRIKLLLRTPTIQNGTLGSHFPVFTEKLVGRKNRLETCVLPSAAQRPVASLRLPKGRSNCLAVSRFSLRHCFHPIPLDTIDEAPGKTLAKARNSLFFILRLYFSS